jgi:phosphopantetheinyl transferase
MRCDVALLAHDLLDPCCGVEEGELHLRLSERERAALSAVAPPHLRRRRAAGRLAAKHLLLRSHERQRRDEPGHERFVALDSARLRAFPAHRYREVELLAADGGGAPRPSLCGEELAARLSIAHAGGASCAAVSTRGNALGIDLETVEPRSGAFYRGNFTAGERAWVAAAAAGTFAAAWLYTFLWTVKEAALKSGTAGVRSVWEFGAVEVVGPADLTARLAGCVGAELGERFAAFDLTVAAAGRRTRGAVETTATPLAILSLFTAATALTAATAALEATP